MGFGTDQQIGNRTSLADLFGNNIGAPQPAGTTQQPNQLFTLLQQLMGGQGAGGQQPPAQGGTPLSAITAQPPQGFGGPKPVLGGETRPIPGVGMEPFAGGMPSPGFGGGGLPPGFGGGTDLGSLKNPFASLINQRSFR